MNISPTGRALISRFEGDVLRAYRDIRGIWTIGRGITGPNIHPGMVITQAESDQMFDDRLRREFDPGITADIGDAATTQDQFDAMVSLSYNIGLGALAHSSVMRDHLAGNHAGAAAAFLWWDHVGGREVPALKRRRAAERALYLSGKIDAEGQPSSDPAIFDLQRRLNEYGITAPTVDGAYGPETRDAIYAFQADRRLPLTGLPDVATIAAAQQYVTLAEDGRGA